MRRDKRGGETVRRERKRERERWIEKGMGEGKRVIGETEQERNGGTVRLKEIEKGKERGQVREMTN